MFLKKTPVYTSVCAFPLASVSNILRALWHTSIITTCIICKDFDQTAAIISCISEWYLPVLIVMKMQGASAESARPENRIHSSGLLLIGIYMWDR